MRGPPGGKGAVFLAVAGGETDSCWGVLGRNNSILFALGGQYRCTRLAAAVRRERFAPARRGPTVHIRTTPGGLKAGRPEAAARGLRSAPLQAAAGNRPREKAAPGSRRTAEEVSRGRARGGGATLELPPPVAPRGAAQEDGDSVSPGGDS